MEFMNIYNDSQVYIPINNRLKVYPTFMRLYIFKTPTIERLKGFSEINPKITTSITTQNQKEDNLSRSLRRTKTTISDLVLSNQFDLFCTFTFKTDRYDIEKSKQKMSTWLQNTQNNYGKFEYLIVPEFHKDKKAIHFHALIKGYKGKLKDSGHKINGRINYNITNYKSGFSSAVKIDNHNKVSSYIRKYITKDMPQFENRKRYWISTGLKRPFTEVNTSVNHNPFIEWSESYNSKNLLILESSSIVKLLTFNERATQWNQKYYTTLPIIKSLQQLTLLRQSRLKPVISSKLYQFPSAKAMRS